MKMRDRLSRIFTLVDDEPVAARQPFLLCDLLCGIQNVQVIAIIGKRCKAWNLGSRHDQDVDRGNRCNVSKRNNVCIFVNDLGRDLTLDDFRE